MIIDHEKLRAFAQRILIAGGSHPGEAGQVADHLVEANLCGHDSHGVGMLVAYCQSLAAGHLVPNQTPEIVQQSETIAVWDARAGFGQRIGCEAMSWAIEAARKHGLSMHGLRNAHHIGRVGAYGELAANAGMVSLHFVNVVSNAPLVAPHRAREGRFMTNPVCVAIPGTDETTPIVLDFATSRIALGKIRVAHNSGKHVVEGALLDSSGSPTTDPGAIYLDPPGVVLPFGEHKGSGLALICEILAGAIVGSDMITTADPKGRGIINGMLTIVLDPNRLSSRDRIESDINVLVDWVKSAAAADHDLPVLLAGEPENIARADRLTHGIPIDDTTWIQICEAAEKLSVPVHL